MMLDATPPPAHHCVSPELATSGTMVLTFAGDSSNVDALLRTLGRFPAWSVRSDMVEDGKRALSVGAPISIPYREIGGLIFAGQRFHPDVKQITDPVICGMEEQ